MKILRQRPGSFQPGGVKMNADNDPGLDLDQLANGTDDLPEGRSAGKCDPRFIMKHLSPIQGHLHILNFPSFRADQVQHIRQQQCVGRSGYDNPVFFSVAQDSLYRSAIAGKQRFPAEKQETPCSSYGSAGRVF